MEILVGDKLKTFHRKIQGILEDHVEKAVEELRLRLHKLIKANALCDAPGGKDRIDKIIDEIFGERPINCSEKESKDGIKWTCVNCGD